MKNVLLKKKDVISWKPEKGRCKNARNYELWAKVGVQNQKMKRMRKKVCTYRIRANKRPLLIKPPHEYFI